jgi:DNA-binding protein HU-beta
MCWEQFFFLDGPVLNKKRWNGMNKEELIEKVAKSSGFTKKNAEKAVTSVLDSIFEALTQNEKVQLIGFGNFAVRDREARKGRNRITGEEVELPADKVPVFAAGKDLKEALNTP